MSADRPTQTRRQRFPSDSIFLTPQEPLRGRAVDTRLSPPETPTRRATTPSGRASQFTTPSGRVPYDRGTRLLTPTECMAGRAARAATGSQQRTPDHTPTKRFPAHQRSRTPSVTARDPSAMMTPRRPRDRVCPTVDLMRVLAKCWDDDSRTRLRMEVKNGLLNGRCEEITGWDSWDPLRSALNNLWGGDRYGRLRRWIMGYKPDQSDAVWYSGESYIGPDDEQIIADPHIHKRPSDPARMGFSSTSVPLSSAGFCVDSTTLLRIQCPREHTPSRST